MIRENCPSSFLCQDLFVAVMGDFVWGPFIFRLNQSNSFWCCPQSDSFQFLHKAIVHGASRPRLVSVITSMDSKGNLGFVPSPSPRACTLSAFDWEASCDHQAAALKHQLFARNCSKCFIYMSRLSLPDRYYDSLFSVRKLIVRLES